GTWRSWSYDRGAGVVSPAAGSRLQLRHERIRRGRAQAPARPRRVSVPHRALRTDAGAGPHIPLRPPRRILRLLRREGHDGAHEEGERDRHDARVRQRPPREVRVGEHRGRRPRHTGENTMSRIADASPTYMLHSAPRVVNRFQNSEYTIVGRLADAATANASATRNATF